MEAANEAARRAVNSLIVASGATAPPAQLWPLQEPEFLRPLQEVDRIRFRARASTPPCVELQEQSCRWRLWQDLQVGGVQGVSRELRLKPGKSASGLASRDPRYVTNRRDYSPEFVEENLVTHLRVPEHLVPGQHFDVKVVVVKPMKPPLPVRHGFEVLLTLHPLSRLSPSGRIRRIHRTGCWPRPAYSFPAASYISRQRCY